MKRSAILFAGLCLWMSACTLPSKTPASPLTAAAPNITILSPASATPPPATPEPAPTATSAPQVATRTHYELHLTLDMSAHTATVDETITYTNRTGQPLNELVLAVAPRLRAGVFNLEKLRVGNDYSEAYTFEGQRMTISLAAPLETGQTITLWLQYALAIPPNDRAHLFGYAARQTNLVEWYPFIVPYQNGWVLHAPTNVGENLVYAASDFDVSLTFAGPQTDFVVAASAPGVLDGEFLHYHLEGARGFHLSASDQFFTREADVSGVHVTSYYFDGHQIAAEQAAKIAVQSIQLFSQKFGPYPHETLSIVETDTYDGLEGDTLFFLSSNYYNEYDGTPQNWLTALTAHETAHAWWYGQVGADQALEPWLDEALCTYAERIFYENLSAELMNWWWSFRVRQYQPSGYVDASIYDYGSFHTYTGAVYRRGAYFLEDLRFRVGDEAFFAFLKDYAAQMSGKIATREDFFRILREHTSTDFSDILQNYLMKP
jgi:hypothetical protein